MSALSAAAMSALAAVAQDSAPEAADEPWLQPMQPGGFWQALAEVPRCAEVRVPLPRMSLRALGSLEVGQVLRTDWPTGEEVPVNVGGVVVTWCEFDVQDGHRAVRLTRLP